MSTPIKKNYLVGVAFMLGFCLLGVTVDGLVKFLTIKDFPFSEIIFLRSAIGVLIFLPYLIKKKDLKISKQALPLYFSRAFFTFVAVAIWFYILEYASLTKLMAIGFTSTLFTTLLAIIFLKEYYDKYSLVALFIGFIGALTIIRPGFVEFNIYLLMALVSAFFWAVSLISTKKLCVSENPIKISFFLSLMFVPMSLFLDLRAWYMPSSAEWQLIVLLAVAGNVGQVFLAQAFNKADLVILMPFEFFTLIFAAIFSYFVFGEVIDKWTIGGALIIIAGAYAVVIGNKRKRISEELEPIH